MGKGEYVYYDKLESGPTAAPVGSGSSSTSTSTTYKPKEKEKSSTASNSKSRTKILKDKSYSQTLSQTQTRCAFLCNVIKKLLLIFAVVSIAANIYTMRELARQFEKDFEELAEIEQLIKEHSDATQASKLSDMTAEKSTGSVSVSKVLPVLRLLENVEKTMRAPSGTDEGRKIVILGKTFILRRDYEIWDYTFTNAGFEPIKTTKQDLQQHKHDDWLAMKCLDLFDGKSHCIEPNELPTLKRHQKVSRLYGLRKTLWNKDRFCDTMSQALAGYEPAERLTPANGTDDFMEFVFPCWLLPNNYDDLIKKARTKYQGFHFIAKPTDRGEGNGINVIDSLKDLARWKELYPENDEIVVQTYLPNPLLINQRKWDMRTYVLVTSIHPLRVYMFRDGLVRFASSVYDPNAAKGGKKTAFLTNTSVNKKAGIDVEDLTWPFPKVYAYMKKNGIDADLLWNRIERAVVQTLLSAEPTFVRGFTKLQADYTCVNCYQLLGVDVIVDDTLVPRIIEINGEPSMQLSGEAGSQYDITKKSMTHDLVALVFSRDSFARAVASDLAELELSGVTIGYEAFNSCTSGTDFCLRKIDLEYLLDMKKEQQNMGGFRRMYPSKNGAFYNKYLEHLETKMPYGTQSSTAKIHKLVTELEKVSRWKTNNDIADIEYYKRNGMSLDFDEEEG